MINEKQERIYSKMKSEKMFGQRGKVGTHKLTEVSEIHNNLQSM